MTQPEAGRVREVLVSAGAEKIALDKGLERPPIGRSLGLDPQPGLPCVRPETAFVTAAGRDSLRHEHIAVAFVDVIDEVGLDVALNLELGTRAG